MTVDSLNALKVGSHALGYCAKCHWLDLRILNGEKLGTDAEYTYDIQAAQPDPWFFVNISRDLRAFDGREFCLDPPFPFDDLARIHNFLYDRRFNLTKDELEEIQAGENDDTGEDLGHEEDDFNDLEGDDDSDEEDD